jgi:hypothetical protein
MTRPSHSSLFGHSNNISWAVKIMRLLIIQFLVSSIFYTSVSLVSFPDKNEILVSLTSSGLWRRAFWYVVTNYCFHPEGRKIVSFNTNIGALFGTVVGVYRSRRRHTWAASSVLLSVQPLSILVSVQPLSVILSVESTPVILPIPSITVILSVQSVPVMLSVGKMQACWQTFRETCWENADIVTDILTDNSWDLFIFQDNRIFRLKLERGVSFLLLR